MKAKYSIFTTMALGLPAFLGGCNQTDFIVDGKSGNTIVMHSIEHPLDTSVLECVDIYLKGSENIKLGDTITIQTPVGVPLPYNKVLTLPDGSVSAYVNGKTFRELEQQKLRELRELQDSARRDLIREVMTATHEKAR